VAVKGHEPVDITSKLRLSTASKLATLGDFNGDGRMDLGLWDRDRVQVALQTAEGTFHLQTTAVKLKDCLSFATLAVGEPARAGLFAGTADGPVLLIPDDDGVFDTREVTLTAEGANRSDLGPGGTCAVADFNVDGHSDIVELFTGGIVFYAGTAPGQFKTPIGKRVGTVASPCSSVCGDYDADGRLDLVVAGEDGIALLSCDQNRLFANVIGDTGELAYHGNMNRSSVIGCVPCDVNSDGRQSVALFGPSRCPMILFNRGFACFGWARELDMAETGRAPVEFADPLNPFGDSSGAKARVSKRQSHCNTVRRPRQ
jgi:hypothetical protein